MPYCIYLRKSRADAEAELRGEGETLARHEKALTAFARQAGLEVTAIYKEIISGETIAARPQMQRLLSEISEGLWDGVIVMDIDRLARGNSIDQGIISQTFLYADTKIITPTKTYDPTNEFDEEYFEFGLFMSRREYKTINRRLQRGRVASVKEGKYVSNKAPYGYERVRLTNDKGYTLAVVPEQAAVVRCIFEWYTTGITKEDGTKTPIGTALIARELNRRRIPSFHHDVWTAQTIRDMLINPVYIGKLRWNWRPTQKKMTDGKVVVSRPRNSEFILYDGLHEAIITEEVFRAAAERFAQNRSRPVRGDKSTQNPLASLVRCQKCGRRMQRRPNINAPDLLMCPAPTCDNHASYLYLVEECVIKMLHQWANGHLTIDGVRPVQQHNYDSEKEELSALLAAENKVNTQLNRAYEAFETGVYDADTFRQRHTALQKQLCDVREKQQALRSRIEKAKDDEAIFSAFIPRTKQIIDAYDTSDPTARNRLLRDVIDHIDYIKPTRGHGHENDFEITVYPRLPKHRIL